MTDDQMGLNLTTRKYRKVLKCLILGEVGALLANLYMLFIFKVFVNIGPLYTLFISYGFMKPCEVLIMGIISGIEVVFYMIEVLKRSDLAYLMNEDRLSNYLFFTLVTFSAVKFFSSIIIYRELKRTDDEGYHLDDS